MVTDRNYRVGFEFNFNSMSRIEVSLSNDFTQLEDSFNPLGDFGTNPLPANSDYNYSYLEFEYRNDQRKKLSYGFEFNNGDFYNGKVPLFESKGFLRSPKVLREFLKN